jgi:hypothetical protein
VNQSPQPSTNVNASVVNQSPQSSTNVNASVVNQSPQSSTNVNASIINQSPQINATVIVHSANDNGSTEESDQTPPTADPSTLDTEFRSAYQGFDASQKWRLVASDRFVEDVLYEAYCDKQTPLVASWIRNWTIDLHNPTMEGWFNSEEWNVFLFTLRNEQDDCARCKLLEALSIIFLTNFLCPSMTGTELVLRRDGEEKLMSVLLVCLLGNMSLAVLHRASYMTMWQKSKQS